MKLLGHRTIGMTLRYAALTGVDVQQAYEEAIATVIERHDLADIRPSRPRTHESSSDATRQSIAKRLEEVETELEKLRRDSIPGTSSKTLRRLLERLRRLSTDIQVATS